MTKDHSTLGTAAYMSPEQARGGEVDHRTDIWAFGVVFYEMLSGQLPFKGDYEQAVVYAILNDEPDYSQQITEHLKLILPTHFSFFQYYYNKKMDKEAFSHFIKYTPATFGLRPEDTDTLKISKNKVGMVLVNFSLKYMNSDQK